jgi:hypothetical protein
MGEIACIHCSVYRLGIYQIFTRTVSPKEKDP